MHWHSCHLCETLEDILNKTFAEIKKAQGPTPNKTVTPPQAAKGEVVLYNGKEREGWSASQC